MELWFINGAATILVLVSWPIYLALFLRPTQHVMKTAVQDRRSFLGVLLQFFGAAVVLIWRRPLFSPLIGSGFPIDFVAPVVAVILATGAIRFSQIALKSLGEQWRFVAGVGQK